MVCPTGAGCRMRPPPNAHLRGGNTSTRCLEVGLDLAPVAQLRLPGQDPAWVGEHTPTRTAPPHGTTEHALRERLRPDRSHRTAYVQSHSVSQTLRRCAGASR
ncbi:MAG: hypothetical protein ABMA02_18290 [Saprospiraceae bacterium]